MLKYWRSCLEIRHIQTPSCLTPASVVARRVELSAGGSAGFCLGGSVPPCRLRRRKFWKFDYEMVHSEVYLNKYVVSIAPFSTPACPDCSQNIQKTALFCMFSLSNFLSIFPVDPICPYVRTPMDRPYNDLRSATGKSIYSAEDCGCFASVKYRLNQNNRIKEKLTHVR